MKNQTIWKKLMTWVTILVYVTQPALVAASVVADPAAVAQQRPSVDVAANGVPVVQITTPSLAGISHNQYQQFNVDPKGLILNNSRVIFNTKLAGYIIANPNLIGNGARVIVNEVTGAKASSLQGYIEIAGQKADLIIANPNGIMGNGFGFINAGRTVLTTGTPVFGGSGSLEAFRVNGGYIGIEGTGLNASEGDRVDLLSRAITVNAGIWAKELNLVTGANKIDYTTLATEKISTDRNIPQLALDVGALGGMYANKISLLGTENGVGVNSKGTIVAKEDLILTSQGKIALAGKIIADQNIHIQTTEELDNSDTLYAQGNLNVMAQADLINHGLLAAGGNTNLMAQTLHSKGTVGAGIKNDGSLQGAGDLTIKASNKIDLMGQNVAAGNLRIQGKIVDMTHAKTYAGNDIDLKVADDINHTGGSLEARGNIAIRASNQFDNTCGEIMTNGNLAIDAQSIRNISGKMASQNQLNLTAKMNIENDQGNITNGDDLTITTQGVVTNGKGTIEAGKVLRITGGRVCNTQQGRIVSIDGSGLQIKTNSLLQNEGLIGSNGTVTLIGNELENNQGQISSQQNMTIDVSNLHNSNGTLVSSQNLRLTAQGEITNSGTVIAGENLQINSGALHSVGTLGAGIKNDGSLQTAGDLTIRTKNKATLQGKNLVAGNLSMEAGQVNTGNSVTYAGQNITIATTSDMDNTNGKVIANEKLEVLAKGIIKNQVGGQMSGEEIHLIADSISNRGGGILQHGTDDTTITATKELANTNGEIITNGNNLTLQGKNITNNDGKIAHAGPGILTITSIEELNNKKGNVLTNGKLAIDVQALDNTNGKMASKNQLHLTGKTEIKNDQGNMISGDSLTINTKGAVINGDGNIEAAKALDLNAERLSNGKQGRIVSTDISGLTITAGNLLENKGLLGSNGAVSLTAQEIKNTNGQITASDLEINAQRGLDNSNGKVYADKELLINASTAVLTNQNGTITAAKNAIVKAGQVQNDSGNIATYHDLSLKATTLAGRGKLQAGDNLILDLQGDYIQNQGGECKTNGNLSITTTGNIINYGTINAVNNLNLVGATITNSNQALLTAGSLVKLKATGIVDNGGRIDSSNIDVTANRITNTGSIIANNLRMQGNTISNTGNAAILATTQGNTILAQDTVENKDGAIIYSLGNVVIAGNDRLGKANRVLNQSATIEAGRDIRIFANDITNKKRFFEAKEQKISETDHSQPLPYDGKSVDISDGDGYTGYRSITAANREYKETIMQTKVTEDSASGQMIAEGNIALEAAILTNEVSKIQAKGALHVVAPVINNVAVGVKRVTTQSGNDVYSITERLGKGGAGNGSGSSGATIKERNYNKTEPYYNQTVEKLPGIESIMSGDQSVTINTVNLNNTTNQPDHIAIGNATTFKPGTTNDVDGSAKPATTASASSIGSNIITQNNSRIYVDGNSNQRFTLPTNGLYAIHKEPDRPYLVETDSRFTNYKNFLSSDYLLKRIPYDPAKVQKRLGDGFYEQKLVREQISQLTGRNFLQDYSNSEEQFKNLLENGAASAKTFNLKVGISLNAEQMAQLTTNIVWLVEKEVEGEKVLVPVVYLANTGNGILQPGGALIAGKSVEIIAQGDIINTGNIQAIEKTVIAGNNILNRGGVITGSTLTEIVAKEDILNQSGIISGGKINLIAGRDLKNETVTNTTHSTTLVSQQAKIIGTDDLFIKAGRDINLEATKVSGQDINIIAGHNIDVGSVAHKDNQGFKNNTTQITSDITATGNVNLVAQNDLKLSGVAVNVSKDTNLSAEHNLELTSAQNNSNVNGARVLIGATDITTSTTNIGTVINGQGNVAIKSANDALLTGTKINAGKDATVIVGHNLDLNSAVNTNYNHSEDASYNHIVSQTTNLTTDIKAGQNVIISASKDVTLQGVQVDAGNDLTVKAKGNITATSVKDEEVHDNRTGYLDGNYNRKKTDDETVIGTTLNAKNTIVIAAGSEKGSQSTGNIILEGSHVNSQNSEVVISATNNITIKNTTEYHENLTQSKKVDSGLLSTKVTENSDNSVINQVSGSTISGDKVTIAAGNDLTVKGSNVVATKDVSLEATGNMNITSAKETGKDEHFHYEKTSGIFSGGGLGFTIGSKSEKITTTDKTLAEIGSTIGSVNGNVSITAGDKVNSAGTIFVAGKDLNITGKDVTIDNTINTFDSQSKYEFKQSGLTVSLGGGIIKAAATAIGDISPSGQVQDKRLQALYDYKAIEDIKKLGDYKGNLRKDIGISVSLGSSQMTSEQTLHAETVNTSNITAGGNVNIIAIDGDVNLKGTKINAADIILDAKRNINIAGAENKQQTMTNTSASSWSVGGTIGIGFDASASKGSSNENGNSTTNTGSVIDASGTLIMKSGNDTNIKGSQVKGDTVIADIKGNLNIVSVQDTDNYKAKNQNIGIGVTGGHTGGTIGSVGTGKTDSNYASVTTQAGVFAGNGGFNITVGKNTDLKGAVIASEAEAVKNALKTGTITFANMENRANYNSSSIGVNLDTRKDAKLNQQGLTPNIGVTASGNAESTTKSAISPGIITITGKQTQDLSGLSRDTGNSLNVLGKIFDKKTVQERQELAGLFGELAYEQVHKISKANGWDDGSSQKIALHAFVGGIMSDIGGSSFISGATGAGLNEALQKQLSKINDPALHQWASAIVGTAVAGIVGGNSQTGASTAVSGTKNNIYLNAVAESNLTSGKLANGQSVNYNLLVSVDGGQSCAVITVDDSSHSEITLDDLYTPQFYEGFSQVFKESPSSVIIQVGSYHVTLAGIRTPLNGSEDVTSTYYQEMNLALGSIGLVGWQVARVEGLLQLN